MQKNNKKFNNYSPTLNKVVFLLYEITTSCF